MGRNSKSKGGAFERAVCKELGLWWTGGKRDDVFWRSAMSGGRATIRHKQHKQTAGHCGDVSATDPSSMPLTKVCVIECKKGHGRTSVGDVLDRPLRNTKQLWDKWVEQTVGEREAAGVPFWMLITKRDARETMVFMPWRFYLCLNGRGAQLQRAIPHARLIIANHAHCRA